MPAHDAHRLLEGRTPAPSFFCDEHGSTSSLGGIHSGVQPLPTRHVSHLPLPTLCSKVGIGHPCWEPESECVCRSVYLGREVLLELGFCVLAAVTSACLCVGDGAMPLGRLLSRALRCRAVGASPKEAEPLMSSASGKIR